MEYVCKVGTPTGEVVQKTFSATDETALRAELEQQGYYLFGIQKGLAAGDLRIRRRRVSMPNLLLFAQELAALLKAGLPLLQSLDVMIDRTQDEVFRKSLGSVREKVKSGTSLSDAFKAEGDLYPPIFSASLVAGERSGGLETVLRRFAQYLRLTQSVKKKAVAAAIYPAVLLTIMGGLVAILLVMVIPQFQEFYKGLGATLPASTQFLMDLGSLIRRNLMVVFAGFVAFLVAAIIWLRQEQSTLVVDRVLLRVPLLGHMMRLYATSQVARTLSTLLSGGLPLVNAMDVAATSIGNRAVATAVNRAVPLIREGKSLTVALESTGTFSPLAIEMVKVGEQTGALGEMLNSLAEFCDEEIDTRMATAMALAEPIMLVLMAIIVAGMLLAFYLPLFELVSKMKR